MTAKDNAIKIVNRCDWAATDETFFDYHDNEWGVAKYDNRTLFEFLVLEMMQAGLSWKTILLKREAFAKAFDNFNVSKIARYDEDKIAQLLADPGIVRHRLKIAAVINNAQRCLQLQQQGSDLSTFVWQLTDGQPIINRWQRQNQCPASTPLSDQMSKLLKDAGFKFIGTTICYSFMQAIGMVDDHIIGCHKCT